MSLLWLRTYLRRSRSLFGRFSSGGHEMGRKFSNREAFPTIARPSQPSPDQCRAVSGNSLSQILGPVIDNHGPRDICLPLDGEPTPPDPSHRCLTSEIYGNYPSIRYGPRDTSPNPQTIQYIWSPLVISYGVLILLFVFDLEVDVPMTKSMLLQRFIVHGWGLDVRSSSVAYGITRPLVVTCITCFIRYAQISSSRCDSGGRWGCPVRLVANY